MVTLIDSQVTQSKSSSSIDDKDSTLQKELWFKCLEDLRYQIKENEFTMWLRPLVAYIVEGDLILVAPNQYFVSHVRSNYVELIQATVAKHSQGLISSVCIQEHKPAIDVSNTPDEASGSQGVAQTNQPTNQVDFAQEKGGLSGKVAQIEGNNSQASHSAQSDKALRYINPNYTFDTFVSGKSNMLAYKACYEIGKRQSRNRSNPLFLYGASGLGKTHLMHSVAHRYLKIGKSFYYFSSDRFVSQMVGALRSGKIEAFKKKIKRVDMLIIDDVHVLADKTKTSTEFLSLFGDFMSDNKQIILASDRHPTRMTEFDERFRSRFASGLAVGIEPPEMETRMQILQKKAQLAGFDLPKECALFIAQNVVSDVRRLEGALNQVTATAYLTGKPIDIEMVRFAIKDLIVIRSQAISMDNIRKVVAEYYEVSIKDMMSKKRTRSIARPRQIAMALSRELTKDSYPDIGQSFGGRDHTTVMHACDKVRQLREEDPTFDKEYQALLMTLQAG